MKVIYTDGMKELIERVLEYSRTWNPHRPDRECYKSEYRADTPAEQFFNRLQCLELKVLTSDFPLDYTLELFADDSGLDIAWTWRDHAKGTIVMNGGLIAHDSGYGLHWQSHT